MKYMKVICVSVENWLNLFQSIFNITPSIEKLFIHNILVFFGHKSATWILLKIVF